MMKCPFPLISGPPPPLPPDPHYHCSGGPASVEYTVCGVSGAALQPEPDGGGLQLRLWFRRGGRACAVVTSSGGPPWRPIPHPAPLWPLPWPGSTYISPPDSHRVGHTHGWLYGSPARPESTGRFHDRDSTTSSPTGQRLPVRQTSLISGYTSVYLHDFYESVRKDSHSKAISIPSSFGNSDWESLQVSDYKTERERKVRERESESEWVRERERERASLATDKTVPLFVNGPTCSWA